MGWLVALSGYRTYIVAALLFVALVLQMTHVLPEPVASIFVSALASLLPVTLRLAIVDLAKKFRDKLPPDGPNPPAPGPSPVPDFPFDFPVFDTRPTAEQRAAEQQRVAVRVYRHDGVAAAALLLCLSLASPAWAQPPRASIDGPATVRYAGQKLVLRAGESTATHHRWRITPVIDGYEQLTPLDDEASAVMVHTMAGKYTVTLIASNADGSDDAALEVTVPGTSPTPTPPAPPAPTPPPGPDPAPGPRPRPEPDPAPGPLPDPVLPRGEFGIAQPVYVAVRSIQDPQRSANATRLAEVAEGLAARIAAGTITRRNDVATEMVAAMRLSPASWAPLNAQIRDALVALEAGRIATVDRWAVLLREIATGLRAAAR